MFCHLAVSLSFVETSKNKVKDPSYIQNKKDSRISLLWKNLFQCFDFIHFEFQALHLSIPLKPNYEFVKYFVVFHQVFAKLIVNGVNEGIHGVLVPIRDENLNILPDVLVEDMGHKMGLNGVDNAKLTFNNVRVPKDNLLNKYSDVGDDGKFHSTILRSLKQFLVGQGKTYSKEIFYFLNRQTAKNLTFKVNFQSNKMSESFRKKRNNSKTIIYETIF